MKSVLLTIVSAALLTLSIYAVSLLSQDSLLLGHVENIHGIPFSQNNKNILIEESLAHADIYLKQPVFAKEIVLNIQFIPANIQSLAVGIRENDFWLSYPKNTMYEQENTPTNNLQPITSKITIPITDKLQETDQSLDLMFFAEGENIQWELVSLTANVQYAWPNYLEFKDYARSILKRERAK